MTIRKILGNCFRDFRKSKGMSISEFAKVTGYAYGTISNVESGLKIPTLALYKKIHTIFGEKLFHLIDEAMNCNLSDENIQDLKIHLESLEVEIENERIKNEEIIKRAIDSAIKKIIRINSYKGLPKQDVEELKSQVEELINSRLKQISTRETRKYVDGR